MINSIKDIQDFIQSPEFTEEAYAELMKGDESILEITIMLLIKHNLVGIDRSGFPDEAIHDDATRNA